MRQSISAQAAVAAHLQAQQQQAHAKAQQQVAAAAVAQQHRNNSFVWQQQAAVANNANVTAQMQNGYSNFMPSMMAMQANNAAQQMAMVATAKLAPSKKNKASSSNLAVRSTVPRFNVAGGIYTVAQWARKCVEDNLEFIVKLARRSDPKADLVMLAYGDGCQTLVFFDEAMNKVPDDLSKIKKIHVGVSAAPIDDKRNETDMAASGVLQPIDSLWDHLRYEQANATKDKKEKIMFIHTSMTVYGDSVVGRQRVLQIKTNAPKSPFVADSYMRNIMFEQQVLAKWKGEAPGVAPVLPQGPMGTAAAVAHVAATTPAEEEDEANEYLITFNPKELLLLEKAFDNSLTPRDLKNKADKWKDEDRKKCQSTILRAQNEFKYVRPRKPNSKKPKPADTNGETNGDNEMKSDSAKDPAAKEDAPVATKKPTSPKMVVQKAKKNDAAKGKAAKESPKRASISKKKETKKDKPPTPKKSSKKPEKKESPVDSDDEPIVKLKTPAKKAKSKAATKKENTPIKKESTPTKPKKSAKKSANSDKKPKSATKKSSEKKKKEEPSKKRGRDKSVGPPPKKTRSGSKSRSSRSKK